MHIMHFLSKIVWQIVGIFFSIHSVQIIVFFFLFVKKITVTQDLTKLKTGSKFVII